MSPLRLIFIVMPQKKRMTYDDWRSKLESHFGRSLPSESAWQEVKNKLTVAELVHGEVIARAPFGAWIDLGVGFPALLEIIEIEGLEPEVYRSGDWCAEESMVEARVAGFDDHNKQIRLTQKQKMRHNPAL